MRASIKHPPRARTPVVGCSVKDPSALAVLRRILKIEGADTCELPTPLRQRHAHMLSGCSALILDLAPWDDSAIEIIRWLRRQRPVLPILLYTPHIPDVTKLVLECGSLHGIFAHSQFDSPLTRSTLQREVRALLESPAGLLLAELVERIVWGVKKEVLEFIRLAIRTLQVERDCELLKVEELAIRVGISTRSLNRIWRPTPFPRPKEMLDWLAMLFVSFEAARAQVPMSRIAAIVGIDPQRWYRIRRRLMAIDLRRMRLNMDEGFDMTLLAFLDRCGVHESDAVAMKDCLMA